MVTVNKDVGQLKKVIKLSEFVCFIYGHRCEIGDEKTSNPRRELYS